MRWPKTPRHFILFIAIIFGLFAFNNCEKVEFRSDAVGTVLRSGETIVGNPMTTAAKTLMAKLCSIITKCHPETSPASCEAEISKLSNINYQLGLPANAYQNFSAIISDESTGALTASPAPTSSCLAAVDQLTCSDAGVQNAYNSATQSYSQVQFMIPTAPGSCPAVFSQPPSRTDYYVSTTGSDSNDGSQSKPWASLTHAASALVPSSTGATVHVASGTYTVPVQPNCGSNSASCGVKTNRSGTSSAPIIYISDQQGGAKIQAPGASAVWYNSGDYVQIVGFEIIGDASANFGIFSEAAFGQVIGNHIHGIPVTNGCATQHAGGGIFFGYLTNAHDNDAIGNLIHDIGPRLPNGLPASSYCQGMSIGISYDQPRGRIQNNIVYAVDNWAIGTWHMAGNLQISHNLLFNNGSLTSTSTPFGGAIFMSGENAVSVHNDTTVSNNIIRNNNGKGLAEYQSVGNTNAYLNNLMFANGSNFNLISGVVPQGTITADPLMVNFQLDGSGDYTLTLNSPAVDTATLNCAAATGTGNCSPSTDMRGVLRPQGPLPDIGPFEWHP